VFLVRPGLAAPDWRGIAWMAAAGAGWGVYSLAGRNAGDPIAATTGNFVRATPVLVLVAAVRIDALHVELDGIVWAVASGVLASGLGYAIWYAALRQLTAMHAAVVQLSVPILAAMAGVLVLDEAITPRLIGSAIAILGGIGLAMAKRGR
jgi:drug/metabolite transporter (DMT)-like permease